MDTSFEQRRFRTAADHYLIGRPPYADALIHRVVQLAGLEGAHRVMDLGCGPVCLVVMGRSVGAASP